MKFKELFTEANELAYDNQGAWSTITSIMKNKHYAKNCKIFDNTLYFEMKDLKGALRLAKKLSINVGFDGVKGIGAEKIGYYQGYISAILDNKDAVAVITVDFSNVTKEVKKLAQAETILQSEYQKRLKALED